MKTKVNQSLDLLIAEHIMGYKWMRWHDLDYESPDGPLHRVLCKRGEWLDDGDPSYVECNLSNPRERDMPIKYHGPSFSYDNNTIGEIIDTLQARKVWTCVDISVSPGFCNIDILDDNDNTGSHSSKTGAKYLSFDLCIAALRFANIPISVIILNDIIDHDNEI